MTDGERESGPPAHRNGSPSSTAGATRRPRFIRVGDQVEVDLSDGLRGRASIVAIERGGRGKATLIEIEVGGTRRIVNARQLTAAAAAARRSRRRGGIRRGGPGHGSGTRSG
jgi:hypothetical protein